MDQTITMMTEEEATEVGPNDIVIHLVNPYKCGICELEFLEKSVFKDHMFSHLEQIKQERPSSQIVMTVILPPETPGGVTVTRDILQLGEDGSIKQVQQPPNSITLNQVQPLKELEEAGVIKLEQPKPLTPGTGLAPDMTDGSTTTPELHVNGGQAAALMQQSGKPGGDQSLLKDTLAKQQNPGSDALDFNSPTALIPNKDGTFSFAFNKSGKEEDMQHIQIIRSDGVKTEVLMDLGAEKQGQFVRPSMRPMRYQRMAFPTQGSNGKTNECDICGKILSSSTNLLRHKMYHSSERPFVCEVCNKGFKDISNLKKHTLIHKRIFPCHLCKKSFLRKTLLDAHLRRHESRTTMVKAGNSQKEVKMRTFVDTDGTRVEEMTMAALSGQTFEYRNRIVKADEGQVKITEEDVRNDENFDANAAANGLAKEGEEEDENKTTQDGDKEGEKVYTVTMAGLQEATGADREQATEESSAGSDLIILPVAPEDFVKIYQCGHCGKRTVQRGNMMRHLIHHLKDRPFACDQCSKCFVDKGELFKHKKTHTKPYRCPHCCGAFAHNVQLMKHLEKECLGDMENLKYTVMEDGQTYKCDVCGVEMRRLGNMIKHVGTHHSVSQDYEGANTPKRFGYPFKHSAGGKPDAPYFYDSSRCAFFCGFCPKSFWTKASVQKHVQVHYSKDCEKSKPAASESKPYKCDLCPLAFSRKLFLDTHRRKHVGETEEFPSETADYGLLKDFTGYFCKHCDKTLPKKYRMMSHVKKHTENRPHECPACNKCFSSLDVLIKHKKSHKKVLVCKKCGETFGRRLSLAMHMKKKHPSPPSFDHMPPPPPHILNKDKGDGQVYPCSYCGVPFARLRIKVNHEKKCLEESKVVERLPNGMGYKCKICGKMATLKHNLMVHIKRHKSAKEILDKFDTEDKKVVDGDQPKHEGGEEQKISGVVKKKKGRGRPRKIVKLSKEGSDSDVDQSFDYNNDDLEEEKQDERYLRTPGGYACVQCRRKFTDLETLQRHLESHSSDNTGEVEEVNVVDETEQEEGAITKVCTVELRDIGLELKETADGALTPAGDLVAQLMDTDVLAKAEESPLPETNEASLPKLQTEEEAVVFKVAEVSEKDESIQEDASKKSNLASSPPLKKVKLEPVMKTPSMTNVNTPSPARSSGRSSRAIKLPSRFLE